MAKYDFDKVIDRRGTSCMKYDGYGHFESDYEDILPLWIADMDFATPSFVGDAVRKRLEHPVLGYTCPPDRYFEAIQNWFEKRYGFRPAKEEISYTPGVVSGYYKLIQCFSHEGDGITILPPVYYPFANVIRGSNRKLVEAPLLVRDERFYIDWDRLDEALSESKMLLFCHPHNPGGRVWSDEELRRVAHMAHEHGVLIMSDEIHADLSYRGVQHHPFPSISEEAREITMSLMAPSKVFNMPGVIGSHFYIPNKELREKAFAYMLQCGLEAASCWTYDAIATAYEQGDEWSRDCMDYIASNVDFVQDYLRREMPGVKMIRPEASFLIFLDFTDAGFKDPDELVDFLIRKCGVFMNDGRMFGTGGDYFMRLNVGEPRSVIEEAMKRMAKGLRERKA